MRCNRSRKPASVDPPFAEREGIASSCAPVCAFSSLGSVFIERIYVAYIMDPTDL